MNLDALVADTTAHLAEPATLTALDRDAYWPKWDGPWWQMLLLWELGRADAIPRAAAERHAAALDRNCLHLFPLREDELPSGCDPYRGVPCHCQLGCVYQVLAAAGLDVDARLPWLRPWFLRYQLPDGGLNCDEAAYLRPRPCSSFLSTLPPLEAVLRCTPRPFTPEEERFLDRGAEYLVARRLWRSLSKDRVIDASWGQLTFPRYYFYDLLRGLSFLAEWADVRGRRLPRAALDEALGQLEDATLPTGELAPGRAAIEGTRTLRRDAAGAWERGQPAGSFPLLEAVSAPGVASPWLTRQWAETRARLERVLEG